MLTGHNYIGYSRYSSGDDSFKSNGNITFHEASEAEINKAATLAGAAFSAYNQVSTEKRIAFLTDLPAAIAAEKELLLQTAMQETHLAKPRLEGEIQRTINQVNLFAALLKDGSWVNAIIDTAQPERKPLPKPDIRQMQLPLGPVAVFGASNFPFAFSVAGGDTIAALAAGCPVVYKSHPAHPATSELMGNLMVEALKQHQMPEGVFSLLQGKTNACSLKLVTHPSIKAVAFTGSYSGGKALYDAAARREEPIPVYAEMGSVNPVFILPGIMQEQAETIAEKLAASNLQSAGQFCTNPGLIFSVKSAPTEKFLVAFANAIKQAAAETMLYENIYNNYNTHIKELLIENKVKLRSYGKEDNSGYAATPHMFQTDGKTFLENGNLWNEVFGPASIHVVANDMAELRLIASKLQGQLTAGVWANEEDSSNAAILVKQLQTKAGRIMFNNIPTGVEVTHAMVHGGPFPATTDSRSTSVGTTSIYRFTRPVCYQNFPLHLLPDALKNENPLHIQRLINSNISRDAVQ